MPTWTDHRGAPEATTLNALMPASEPRYCVAQVTEDARDGWRDFCDRYGVDRTALAEVIGLRLGETAGHLPPVLERWVTEAKDLKNQRRRRG